MIILLIYGLSFNFPAWLWTLGLIPVFFIGLNKKKVSKTNKSALILTAFLLCYFFFSLLPSIFYDELKGGFKNALYLIICLIPLFYSSYHLSTQKYITHKTLLISFSIIAPTIYILYVLEYIDSGRYQQVGNLMSILAILLFYCQNKIYKLISFCCLVLVLQIGSRQSLLGFILAVIFPLMRNTRNLLLFFFLIIFFGNADMVKAAEYLNSNLSLFEFKYNLNFATLKRFLALIISESTNVRLTIWEHFFEITTLFPQGIFFAETNNIIDQPHNFFIEFNYVCGYILGIPFMLFTCYLLIKSSNRYNVFGALMMFSFVPFNISWGLTAAKYFLLFTFIHLGTTQVDRSS